MLEKFRKNAISPNEMKHVKGGVSYVYDCVKENGVRVLISGPSPESMNAYIDIYNDSHDVDIVGCDIPQA